MVPDDVREEITNPGQRAALDDALARNLLGIVQVTGIADVALFADLRARLGRGEAACLALAQHHGWTVASDEKGRFRREAERRIGMECIIGTAEILHLAIRGGHLTIPEADSDKQVLETRRFRMAFVSFSELVEAADQGEP